ncbi:uncharacterized protein TEOVI_000367000 [Trypanosoma equiperdum]|uniref:DUF7759 domain-containing protein n=1 Tax=Trypanosoma equiperdum TaxID=5694 RepID=A0A1G4II04_TRYEQ|nr:hypothetical protein, conserved [Trypanosoma equiperdum]
MKAEEEAERMKAEEDAERVEAEEDAERVEAEEEAERMKAEGGAGRKNSDEEGCVVEEEGLGGNRASDGPPRIASNQECTLSEQQRHERARKKLERYRKQVMARNQRPVCKVGDVTAAAVTQAVGDVPLISTSRVSGLPTVTPVSSPSEATLVANALIFPNGSVAIEKFDENRLVVRRQSLDVPWDIGLRFDWTVKTLAIGSLPMYRLSDPRRLHPFMRTYQSKPVWFLEEVNGTKANNIREVMEVLKKSLLATFVFRK